MPIPAMPESGAGESPSVPRAEPQPKPQSSASATCKPLIEQLFTSLAGHMANALARCPAAQQFLDDTGINEIVDRVARHIARHPGLTFAIGTLFVSIALPFVAFMLFACVTVMLTFVGFVIIEGTLITLASVMLFSFLGGVAICALFGGACVLLAYVAFAYVCELLFPGNAAAATHFAGGRRRRTAGADTSSAHRQPDDASSAY